MTTDNCRWGRSQIWVLSSCAFSQHFLSKKKIKRSMNMAGVFWSPPYKRELKACQNHRTNFLAHCRTFTAIWTPMIKTQFWLTFSKWNPTICTCDLGKQRRKVGMINIFLTLYISSILDILIVQVKGWIKLFFGYTYCQSYQGQQFKSVYGYFQSSMLRILHLETLNWWIILFSLLMD